MCMWTELFRPWSLSPWTLDSWWWLILRSAYRGLYNLQKWLLKKPPPAPDSSHFLLWGRRAGGECFFSPLPAGPVLLLKAPLLALDRRDLGRRDSRILGWSHPKNLQEQGKGERWNGESPWPFALRSFPATEAVRTTHTPSLSSSLWNHPKSSVCCCIWLS